MRRCNLYFNDKQFLEMDKICKFYSISQAEFIRQSVDTMLSDLSKLDTTKQSNRMKQDWLKTSSSIHEALEGLLLSDASIGIAGRYPRLHFSQSVNRLEYVQFIAKKLDIADRVKVRSKFDKRTNRVYECAEFKTVSSPELFPYHHRWYKNGYKEIPQDFIITPVSLLHEFLGDGGARYRKDQGYEISLATNSFSKDSIDNILVPQFQKLNIRSYISSRNELCIADKTSYNNFFEYIGTCPVPCFQYKWPELSH